MASSEDVLTPILSRLDSQIKSGQRKKALRTVEEGLKVSSKDQDLIRAKLYLLIDLDRILDALALIHQQKGDLPQKVGYEKAYCLYRSGEFQKALDTLESLSVPQKEAHLQLKAQLLYRLGDFDAAIKIYQEVVSEKGVSDASLKTNIVAAYTAGNHAADVRDVAKSLKISPNDGFEVAFNLACSTLQCGLIKEAQECLLLALRLGREGLLEEDFTEEQVEQELAPLNAQLAYVSAACQEHQASLDTYQELVSSGTTDEGLHALATNNLIAVRLLTTPPDQQRKLVVEAIKELEAFFEKGSASLKLKPSVEQRLSQAQQQALYFNRVLLQILSGRYQSAKDLTQQLTKRYKDAGSIGLLKASLLAKDSKLKDAEAALMPGNQANASFKEVVLMRAQLAAEDLKPGRASEILSALESKELTRRPAFVATQAAFLEASDQGDAALELVTRVQEAELADRQKTKPEKAIISKGVLPIIARLQLKVGAVSNAFKTFKQLHSVDASTASSAAVVGQLAAAALDHDPAAASSLQQHLSVLPEMQPDAVDKLETTGISRMSKGDARAGKSTGGEEATHKRKRKRKTRLPKNFDPENPGPPPDPERWLPKWQRSEYKRKRRNRKDKGKLGHQGGAVDESLDRTHAETPAAAPLHPNLPRRNRGRAKGSRR